MAPTLIAVANTTTRQVDLTVTGAVGAITVTAYTGSTSRNVRGSFVNGRKVPDPDAAFNIPIVYIARDAVPSQSPQVEVTLTSSDAVISSMSNPSLHTTVELLADDSQNYEGASVAHKILGSNLPLVSVLPMAFRQGTYELLARTVQEWLVLRQMQLPGSVLLLRSPCQTEYLDTSFIILAARVTLRWNSQQPRMREVSWDYQATAPDTTPPNDIAWAWGDVPGQFATWGAVPLAVPTWAAMVTYLPVP
jgi:hypothetical protein